MPFSPPWAGRKLRKYVFPACGMGFIRKYLAGYYYNGLANACQHEYPEKTQKQKFPYLFVNKCPLYGSYSIFAHFFFLFLFLMPIRFHK